MSIQCDNTTPLIAKSGSTLTPDSDLFDNIIDLGSLILDDDPFDNESLDRNSIVKLTNGLNGLLGSSDLTGFDTLKDRYGQFPLTYTEIADFALSENQNVDELNSALEGLQAYGMTTDRLALGQFVGYGKDGSDANGAGGDSSNVVRVDDAKVASLLSDLDFYYNSNLGASISAGVCGEFGNALLKLLAVFQLLDTLNAKLAGLNLKDLDPRKLAIQLAQKLKIEAILKSIEKTIEKLIEKVKKKVLQAINSIVPQLKNMGCASKSFFRKIRKKIDQINEFFSKENIERIMDEVQSFIGNMVANFERLTLENVLLMMHKLCRFTEALQAMLTGDSDEVAKIAAITAKEVTALEALSKKETKKAVENGAIRVSPEERLKKREEVIAKNNSEAKEKNKDEDSDYITDPCPTQKEIEKIKSISDAGLGDSITFSSSVVKNKEWQDIDNSVWSKLLRIVDQTEDEYEVLHGVKKKTETTATLGGTSNHIHLTGYAIDIKVNSDNIEETIKAASRAGFSGIGVYKSFLHLDVGTRRSWVAGEDGINIEATEQFKDKELSKMQELTAKHDIDGFRKKRAPVVDLSTRFETEEQKEARRREAQQLRDEIDREFKRSGFIRSPDGNGWIPAPTF